MENIIKDKLLQYLNKNKLINKQQHGFVFNKACNTNLLETMDTLTKLLADKESFDMLLLDFAKAFDKVAHKRLNLKLTGYGKVLQVINASSVEFFFLLHLMRGLRK